MKKVVMLALVALSIAAFAGSASACDGASGLPCPKARVIYVFR